MRDCAWKTTVCYIPMLIVKASCTKRLFVKAMHFSILNFYGIKWGHDVYPMMVHHSYGYPYLWVNILQLRAQDQWKLVNIKVSQVLLWLIDLLQVTHDLKGNDDHLIVRKVPRVANTPSITRSWKLFTHGCSLFIMTQDKSLFAPDPYLISFWEALNW